MFALATAAAVFICMLAEMLLSRRNERLLRARGAVEPAGDVYRTMAWAYPACFLAMAAEAALHGAPRGALVTAGVLVFAAAKTLKLWAIYSLGVYWSFRVLVVPGHRLVATGPYRFVRHPNYVAVAGEIIGIAILLDAVVTGIVASAGFAALMLKRIAIEERALRVR